MEPQLESLRKEFEAIRNDAASLVDGLSGAQLTWQPKPGAWSINQCLAHLNLIDGQALPHLFKAIQLGRQNGQTGAGPFRWSWFARTFISHVEPPSKTKVPAPKRFQPPAAEQPDPRETYLEFQRIQHDLSFLTGQADGLDLKGIKVPSPAGNWLKMSLGARLDLIGAHDRRHLWQARRVFENPNFPKKS